MIIQILNVRGREVTKQIGMPYTRVQTANHPYINAVSDFLSVNEVCILFFYISMLHNFGFLYIIMKPLKPCNIN